METTNNNTCLVGGCKCPCHKFVPAMITLIGIMFLLAGLNVVSANVVNIGWPIALILIGLKKMFKCKCCAGCGK